MRRLEPGHNTETRCPLADVFDPSEQVVTRALNQSDQLETGVKFQLPASRSVIRVTVKIHVRLEWCAVGHSVSRQESLGLLAEGALQVRIDQLVGPFPQVPEQCS
jgi:hypothetical protein